LAPTLLGEREKVKRGRRTEERKEEMEGELPKLPKVHSVPTGISLFFEVVLTFSSSN